MADYAAGGDRSQPSQAPSDDPLAFPAPQTTQAPAGEHTPDSVLDLPGHHPAHWHPTLGAQHHAAATSPPASPTALYPRNAAAPPTAPTTAATPDSPTQRLRAMHIKLPSTTWWLDGTSRPSSPLAALHPELDPSARRPSLSPASPASYPSSASFPIPTSFPGSGSLPSSPSFVSSAAPSSPSTPPIDPTKLNNVPVHTPPRDSPPGAGARRPSFARTPSGSISDDGLAALNLALARTTSPTVAETGLKLAPVDGPSSGQLERKEKKKDVIRLDSFGGEGLERKPSGRASFSSSS